MGTSARDQALAQLRSELGRVDARIDFLNECKEEKCSLDSPKDNDYQDEFEAEDYSKAAKKHQTALHVDPNEDNEDQFGAPHSIPPTPATLQSSTPKSYNTGKSLPATPKSIRSAKSSKSAKSAKSTASRSSTVDELREVAVALTSEDIHSMLCSALVQQSMASLGFCLIDVLPELQASRLQLPMASSAVLEHLERRRIEALIMLLRERERRIHELERSVGGARPRTSQESAREKLPEADKICQRYVQERERRNQRFLSTRERVKEAKELEARLNTLRLAQQQEEINRVAERATAVREEKKMQARVQLEARMQANAKARRLQETLLGQRKHTLASRLHDSEKRVESVIFRRVQEIKEVRERSSLVGGPSADDAPRAHTEAHRQKVKEEAKRLEEHRYQEMQKQLLEKKRNQEQAMQCRKHFLDNEKAKQQLQEIDRIIKLERLHRQSEHRKLLGQTNYCQKQELLRAQDKVQEMLQQERQRHEKEEMSKRLRRQHAAETGPSDLPGPGSYDILSSLGGVNFSIAKDNPERRHEKSIEKSREEPGPGEYRSDVDISLSTMQPGTSFTRGHVLSDLDWTIKRAQEIPGPGTYELESTVGKNSPAASMGGLSSELLRAARAKLARSTPGPADYYPNLTL